MNVPTTHLETPGKISEKPRWKTMSAVNTEISLTESEESDENEPTKVTTMAGPDISSPNDFRVSFLRKLSQEKVWLPKPQRPPSHQTVIIFDWDDTLLCTTFVNEKFGDYFSVPPSVQLQLKEIAKAAQVLLELSLRLGHTFIITNAASNWVQYSAAKYLPDLLPTLERVRIISARSRHEEEYPNEVAQWKVQAFLDVQRQLDSQIITNLVALGDSQFEMDAAHTMGKEFEVALVKTIKFHQNPCPEALLKQLQIVGPKLERIVENARHMKIALERKEKC